MKPLTKVLVVSALALALQCGSAFAQRQGQGQGQARPDWANMDPQQMQQQIQQMMMDSFREQLGVTNDAEWGIIQERLAKVTRLRTESMMTGARGMMGGRRGMGGGMGGGRGMAAAFGQTDPAVEALQKAIDDNSPTSQLKDALTRLRENRKQKQAELTKAQADLRAVLTLRQEAILVANGMLD